MRSYSGEPQCPLGSCFQSRRFPIQTELLVTNRELPWCMPKRKKTPRIAGFRQEPISKPAGANVLSPGH